MEKYASPFITRLHFLLCVLCFQWAFMELTLRFRDNVSWCNSESLNSGLYFFQACSSRAFFACRGHRWKSMILKTHLREVRQCIPCFTSQILKQDKPCFPLIKCHHWRHKYSSSGEDPLVDDQNEHDINSVAGVLKLYFRGLENPLFPKERFLDFISTISESCTAKVFKAITVLNGHLEAHLVFC